MGGRSRSSTSESRRLRKTTRSPRNVGSGGSVSESSMSQTLRTAREAAAGDLVEVELVALDVLHHDARLVVLIGHQDPHEHRAERGQPRAFGLQHGQALSTHEPGADPHVKVHPVLDDLAFGNALEEQPRAYPGGINAGEPGTLLLRGQRAIDLVPRGEPLRRRWYDVPQHLAPEASEALGFRAVEGDLDLPHRCHRPTIPKITPAAIRGAGR